MKAAPAVPRLSRQVRCFSTSVLRPFIKPVRPPVQIYGIKGRYATALYSAASKQNKLEQVAKESLRVGQILKEPEMAASIMNPYVKCYIEVKSLNDMTAKERFSPLTSGWISLLAEDGRLNNTPGAIYLAVTTVPPLGEATLAELKTVLKSFLSKGQVLKLEVKIEPSIMGGMIVRTGEKYVFKNQDSEAEQTKSKRLRQICR
uniref:ATP synthase peripheral stalk subunit OSCP, mitochondrial n=1 Tax=Balaenoptera musculus TaxID=9771 RepID=A0A8C0DG98_BALMU